MDPMETTRATVAIHAPARAFAPGTQTALVRLGYHLVSAETATKHSDGDWCRPAIRIVDDRQLEKLPLESDGPGSPIILLTGHRGPLASDSRAVGTVRRRARVNELFALPKEGLVQLPAQPSYVHGKLAGLVFRDTSERSRSAIANYVTAQLTAS